MELFRRKDDTMVKNFHDKVVYQVYPKSWKDTTGTGMGDLQGVIEKLPYLADLGIDLLWLNPFYKSPQNDNGYDIADYQSIDPMYGDFDTFDKLVQEASKYNIGLMLDMVLNHVSTEHEWFQRALAGEEQYQDYFILRQAQPDGSLPTNWESKFGGPAWNQFGDSNYYYLCLYDKTQADLNWHNPEVREALYDVVNFWINKGVKGFRFDVLNVIGKSQELKDAADGIGKSEYTDTPIVHEWVRELNKRTFGRYDDIITVGEMSSTDVSNSVQYSHSESNELDMVFSFHHLKVDYKNRDKWTLMDFDFDELKRLLDHWQTGMQAGNGWNALFWNNHDQPRSNSRFADPVNYPYESATMLATTIHLLRGTPYIYQGEEIGMTNPNYESIDQYDDVETHNAYRTLLAQGMNNSEALAIIQAKSRDNSRTPMQWSSEEQAGFTTGQPWLEVASNYENINTLVPDPSQRIRDYYKQLIRLRKDYAVISEGTYRSIQLDHPDVYSYMREYDNQQVLVFNNFYGKQTAIDVPEDFLKKDARVLIGNYDQHALEQQLVLQPYESIAFLLE